MSQWMKLGREQGEEGLRGKIAAGPPVRLTKEQLEQLPRLLAQGAEAHGFQGEVWTTQRVAVLIQKQFGVSYLPADAYESAAPSDQVQCAAADRTGQGLETKRPSRPGKRSDGPR